MVLSQKCCRLLILLVLLNCMTYAQGPGGGAAAGKAAGKDSGGQKQAANPDAVHDVITGSFKSTNACIAKDGSTQAAVDVSGDLNALAAGKELDWNSSALYKLVSYYYGPLANLDSQAAYIFHVASWTRKPDHPDQSVDNPPYALASSSWYVYTPTRNNKLEQSGFKGTGDPLIYGKKRLIIIGLDTFDPDTKGFLISTYNISVTQGIPENLQNIGQLAAGLLGISGAQAQAAPKVTTCGLFVAAKIQQGSKKLPYDVSVTAATVDANGNKPNGQTSGQNVSPGTASCTEGGNSTPCTTNRTFTSADREWWDVSIGVTTPGVRESQYSIVSNALQMSATRHTDFYGMFDIFPAAAYLPKESWFPHFNIGIPVASKSLYRPYFGLGEDLTSWTHFQKNLGLPIDVNFFAGVVWMKTQVVGDNPTTSAQLTADTSHKRVWKALFGIEVPVSSIASKLGKGGGSKNSSGSGKSGSGAS